MFDSSRNRHVRRLLPVFKHTRTFLTITFCA